MVHVNGGLGLRGGPVLWFGWGRTSAHVLTQIWPGRVATLLTFPSTLSSHIVAAEVRTGLDRSLFNISIHCCCETSFSLASISNLGSRPKLHRSESSYQCVIRSNYSKSLSNSELSRVAILMSADAAMHLSNQLCRNWHCPSSSPYTGGGAAIPESELIKREK